MIAEAIETPRFCPTVVGALVRPLPFKVRTRFERSPWRIDIQKFHPGSVCGGIAADNLLKTVLKKSTTPDKRTIVSVGNPAWLSC